MQDSILIQKRVQPVHRFRVCPAVKNQPIFTAFPVLRRRDERGRWNPVNPSHPGAASPLPAMTDDRHADALRVTRRERRQEYQGTGGRDEEAPAPEGAEAPRRHETANPRIRGKDTALRAVISIHDSRPKDSRSDAGAGARGDSIGADG